MDISALSDEQLVDMIRKKDSELYREIIRRYQAKLTRYVRRFVCDADEAEDVLQTVFIKSFQNLHAFDVSKKFSSWIYRIAHNESINAIRKKSNTDIPLDEVEYKIISDEISLDERVDQSFLKTNLGTCLAEIDRKYREPIMLFYFEHKTYEEISDILRIPRNTVGTLISRGKRMLKEKIILQNAYE